MSLSKCLVRPVFFVILSIGSVIGVACLLIVMSLFENYYLSAEKVFMGIHPNIEIHRPGMLISDAKDHIQMLKKKFPEIQSIAPALYSVRKMEISEVKAKKEFCILKDGVTVCPHEVKRTEDPQTYSYEKKFGFEILDKRRGEFLIKGIDIQNGETVLRIKRIINGNSNLERLNQTSDANGNSIPCGFYMEQPPASAVTPLTDFLISFPDMNDKDKHYCRLTGNLSLGRKTGRLPLVVMSLNNVQRMLKKEQQVNAIEINLNQPYESERVARDIRELLGEAFEVFSWTEKEEAAFRFLHITKIMIFFIIFNISIVAALSVFSTLMLSVTESRKKIAIFKAIGMKNRTIYSIFVSSALTVCMIGIIFGSLTGYITSYYFVTGFSDTLQKLGIDTPEVMITAGDIAMISLFSLVLFLITAILPARNAVAIDPVDNLQD